jgi:hypothetical protein
MLSKSTLRRKYLVWLMVSVHGWLALLLLGLWQSRNIKQKGVAKESSSLHAARRQEEGKEGSEEALQTLEVYFVQLTPPPPNSSFIYKFINALIHR